MSRLDELRASKALMWESLQMTIPEKRAPLMAQWRALEKEIAELSADTGKAGDPIDEIAARRTARGGATARIGKAARRPG